MTTFALLPAGGKSLRMGRPKLCLPLGGRTVLEHAIRALRHGGAENVLVVVAPHVQELVPLAEAAGAWVLPLREETADMRTTVEHGLDWLEERFQPAPNDGWFLCPADHPALDAAVVGHLLQERRAGGAEHTILVPTHQGRRGHPALLDWGHVAPLRYLEPGVGINVYLRRQAAVTREVPVASPTILLDIDTPEDYERLRAAFDKVPPAP